MPDATTLAQGIVSRIKRRRFSSSASGDAGLHPDDAAAHGGAGGERALSVTLLDHPNIQMPVRRPHHAQAAGMDDDAANGER
jgi:hypothetical protein